MIDRRTGLRLLGAAGAVGAAMIGGRLVLDEAAARSRLIGGAGFPYDEFDTLPAHHIRIGAADVVVAFSPGDLALSRPQIFEWVRRGATAVATYYGHLPATRVLVVPVDGGGVQGGTTWGYRGCAIRMLVGAEADAGDLERDWMMTHEFVHTALPQMDYRYNWLSEGLAVYVEPIARVQTGYLTAESIWADMVRDMPKGLPRSGDLGLDNTPTWGRTYWGGAIFCLLSDIGIRGATGNRRGLQDAMRGVLAANGNHTVEWPIERILATADKTVGQDTMNALYERLRATPERVDLDAIWKQLGIEVTADGLRLHDDAPLSATRVAITARPPIAG